MPGIPLVAQPRYQVAAAIMKAQANPREVVILGGDNIYAVEGSKAHNEAEFDIGANFFGEADVFTAIGNHNLGVFADTGRSKLDAHAEAGWIPAAGETYYRIPFAEADVIVLDTNLRRAAHTAQCAWLGAQLAELRATGRPWWLIQHEPFASFKKIKEGKMKRHQLPNVYARPVFHYLKQWPPIAILCADTHNYQVGSLTFPGGIVMRQYVVGSGGGIPDRITGADVARAGGGFATELFQYQIEDLAEGFGFLRVTGPGAAVFQPVMPWMAGGARSKNQRQTQRRWGHRLVAKRARRSQKRSLRRSPQ